MSRHSGLENTVHGLIRNRLQKNMFEQAVDMSDRFGQIAPKTLLAGRQWQ